MASRLAQLKFAHQTLGYVWSMRKGNPNLRITGSIPDVVLVAGQKREAIRTYYTISATETESWRSQLVQTVSEWRQAISDASDMTPMQVLDRFYQDTERCFDYGKCSFYDLCDYGMDSALLTDFEENTWNPLTYGKQIELEVF